MIGQRESTILDLLIREYIRTAEPVSSEKIARRMRHALSPASIRSIFTDLTDGGFIEQPHTSGGRVPKARAYRFFVDRILDGGMQSSDLPDELARCALAFEKNIEDLREIQEELARHLHVISRFGSLMPIGFDEMFSEPEFSDEPGLMREIGRFLDQFEGCRDEYDETLVPNSFDVMIGEENSIQPMRSMSLVVGKNSDEGIFFIAGPMRMPYDQIITMMRLWQKKPI